MKHRYPHTTDPREYAYDSTKRTWTAAKNRKRRSGCRVTGSRFERTFSACMRFTKKTSP